MRRFLIAAIILSAAVPAAAQLYKWVDKDGKTYYSDSPPPNQDTKRLSVGTGTTAEPAAAPKTAVQRDKDMEKGRQDAREAAKKSDDAVKQSAAQVEQCNVARSNLQGLVEGGRIARYNSKGEREVLSDEDIAKELERAKNDVAQICKKT
ncbi:hypothetical protein DSM104443_01389 [Usitatibacter rugosus]|uniref:DUF4124 domain-containing protein n=1 Tax=Usitatibacter rugosus TaxID=2732067 RepID=A0A6M4GSV5_9PROT|nr:DUF4124 domain-containing protein [Usitatibacter rugosus]QJR10331.1 hypothetical protein DSM104443_01389 [Usitatibacter rugosus]